jgi:hypothetical protein
MIIDAILPAAGEASRMRGFPKFLLPSDVQYRSLIEKHVHSLLEVSKVIWIPTRPDLVELLHTIEFPTSRVIILPLKTQSMMETVDAVASLSSADKFLIGMPDTYFYGTDPYSALASSSHMATLALWKIRESQIGKLGQVEVEPKTGRVLDIQDKKLDCAHEFAWGAMALERECLDYVDTTMSSLGDLIPKLIEVGATVFSSTVDGDYFDCGTPEEYFEMLIRTQSL